MHPIQQAILDLADKKNLKRLTLRDIGRIVTGEDQHPQAIQYHINRLLKAGLLREDKKRGVIERVSAGEKRMGFVSLPIVGAANCGPATIFAEESIEGYLQLSENLVPKNREKLFVLRAVGNSMNAADIKGKSIEDGDFVLIDGKAQTPNKFHPYVLSVIGGVANIKKFIRQKNQIVLASESTEDFPPIYVHEDDALEFFINGLVLDVLKKPRA